MKMENIGMHSEENRFEEPMFEIIEIADADIICESDWNEGGDDTIEYEDQKF